MVSFYGDYNLTETVNIPFNTFTSDDPSASCTVTDLANTDIYVHKDGVEGTPGDITVSLNVGSVNGNHLAILDLSNTDDADFYAVGSRYQVRMEGVTIDGATVNAWIGAFSIGCTLRPTTVGRTLTVESDGVAHADVKEWLGTACASAISAANLAKLEDILDGTGGTGITLNKLTINASDADGAIDIDNDNGPGIQCDGGDGAVFQGDSGVGIQVVGATDGITAEGEAGSGLVARGTSFGIQATASAGPALSCVASAGNNSGIVATKSGSGYDIDADIHGTIDTCTANSDMRGTNSANTVVPPSLAQFNARTLVAAEYFAPSTDKVYLGDGAHGGSSATLTLSDYSDFTGSMDAAGVRSANGMASADLDDQLDELSTFDASSDKVLLADAAMGGTSLVLTLGGLVINASRAGGAVDIDNDAGRGIDVVSTSSDAVKFTGHTNFYGLHTRGGAGGIYSYGIAGHGVVFQGNSAVETTAGMYIRGAKYGIYAYSMADVTGTGECGIYAGAAYGHGFYGQAAAGKSGFYLNDGGTQIARTGADSDTLETLSDEIAAHGSAMAAAFTEIKGATWSATTDTLEAIRDRGDAAWASTLGAGAITHTCTVTDGTNPIEGVDVWITTDEAGTNIVARGSTDASGQVVFHLDAATYYIWKEKSGYTFTNPEDEVVA